MASKQGRIGTGDADRGLSLAEHVCLALVVERPRHGWALVKELGPDSQLGSIWSLSRPLTYRAVELLESKGLIDRGEAEPAQGPNRVPLFPTTNGRRINAAWLGRPVDHIRDLRTEFLLKATLLQRQGRDVLELLDAQEALLSPKLSALGSGATDGSPVALWRRESARAAQRFFVELRSRIAHGQPSGSAQPPST